MRAIRVINDNRKTKKQEPVGVLALLDTEHGPEWEFKYEDSWLRAKHRIPVGMDLPLSPNPYRSKQLFITFEERLPFRENRAYKDYCESWHISVDEGDILTLLSTLGHRGPSTFVFNPIGFAPGIWGSVQN